MIRYIYAEDLDAYPLLKSTMFRDRATQFKTRLNWEVTVDATGFEIDQYDTLNPLYVIYEMEDGTHGGSSRFLPTTGQTMINDHFLDLTDGVKIESPLIWECTRFCVSPRAGADIAREIASSLLIGACEMGLQFGASDSVGVFDARMVRIYRRIGWEPTVLGTKGEGRDATSVGIWELTEDACDRMCDRANITRKTAKMWLDASFSAAKEVQAA